MRSGVRFGMNPLVMAIVSASALAGCQAPPPPPPPPKPVTWMVPAGRSLQVAQLTEESKKLDRHVSALPGANPFEHRKVMSAVLESVSRSVALAAGSNPSPEIVNQRTVIEHARQVIDAVDVPDKRSAAVENEAIVAALGALRELAARPATPDPAVAASLADAEMRLDSLQMTQGPLHELDATQTLSSVATAVRLLAADYNGNGPVMAEMR